MVNEKRYGRWSRPDASYSEDLYSADDESMIESRPESHLSDSRLTSEVDRHEAPAQEVRTIRVHSFGGSESGSYSRSKIAQIMGHQKFP